MVVVQSGIPSEPLLCSEVGALRIIMQVNYQVYSQINHLSTYNKYNARCMPKCSAALWRKTSERLIKRLNVHLPLQPNDRCQCQMSEATSIPGFSPWTLKS